MRKDGLWLLAVMSAQAENWGMEDSRPKPSNHPWMGAQGSKKGRSPLQPIQVEACLWWVDGLFPHSPLSVQTLASRP